MSKLAARPGEQFEALHDTEGIVLSIYHQLWQKNAAGHGCPGVNLPYTILYEGGKPVLWFFTSEKEETILRKRSNNVRGPTVYEALAKEVGPHGVCAAFRGTLDLSSGTTSRPNTWAEHPEASPCECILSPPTTEYMTSSRLADLMKMSFSADSSGESFHRGVLQKFVEPRDDKNCIIRATWTPKICLLERRVNRSRLDDDRVSVNDRCCTFEGLAWKTEAPNIAGTALSSKVHGICNNIAAHIHEINDNKIKLLHCELYFSVDANNAVWFLFASDLRLESSVSGGLFIRGRNGHLTWAPSLQTDETGCLPARSVGPGEEVVFICAATGAVTPLKQRYEVTYRSLMQQYTDSVSGIYDGEERAKALAAVPPALRRAMPTISKEWYLRHRDDPEFQHHPAYVSKAVFLQLQNLTEEDISKELSRKLRGEVSSPKSNSSLPPRGASSVGPSTPSSRRTPSYPPLGPPEYSVISKLMPASRSVHTNSQWVTPRRSYKIPPRSTSPEGHRISPSRSFKHPPQSNPPEGHTLGSTASAPPNLQVLPPRNTTSRSNHATGTGADLSPSTPASLSNRPASLSEDPSTLARDIPRALLPKVSSGLNTPRASPAASGNPSPYESRTPSASRPRPSLPPHPPSASISPFASPRNHSPDHASHTWPPIETAETSAAVPARQDGAASPSPDRPSPPIPAWQEGEIRRTGVSHMPDIRTTSIPLSPYITETPPADLSDWSNEPASSRATEDAGHSSDQPFSLPIPDPSFPPTIPAPTTPTMHANTVKWGPQTASPTPGAQGSWNLQSAGSDVGSIGSILAPIGEGETDDDGSPSLAATLTGRYTDLLPLVEPGSPAAAVIAAAGAAAATAAAASAAVSTISRRRSGAVAVSMADKKTLRDLTQAYAQAQEQTQQLLAQAQELMSSASSSRPGTGSGRIRRKTAVQRSTNQSSSGDFGNLAAQLPAPPPRASSTGLVATRAGASGFISAYSSGSLSELPQGIPLSAAGVHDVTASQASTSTAHSHQHGSSLLKPHGSYGKQSGGAAGEGSSGGGVRTSHGGSGRGRIDNSTADILVINHDEPCTPSSTQGRRGTASVDGRQGQGPPAGRESSSRSVGSISPLPSKPNLRASSIVVPQQRQSSFRSAPAKGSPYSSPKGRRISHRNMSMQQPRISMSGRASSGISRSYSMSGGPRPLSQPPSRKPSFSGHVADPNGTTAAQISGLTLDEQLMLSEALQLST